MSTVRNWVMGKKNDNKDVQLDAGNRGGSYKFEVSGNIVETAKCFAQAYEAQLNFSARRYEVDKMTEVRIAELNCKTNVIKAKMEQATEAKKILLAAEDQRSKNQQAILRLRNEIKESENRQKAQQLALEKERCSLQAFKEEVKRESKTKEKEHAARESEAELQLLQAELKKKAILAAAKFSEAELKQLQPKLRKSEIIVAAKHAAKPELEKAKKAKKGAKKGSPKKASKASPSAGAGDFKRTTSHAKKSALSGSPAGAGMFASRKADASRAEKESVDKLNNENSSRSNSPTSWV